MSIYRDIRKVPPIKDAKVVFDAVQQLSRVTGLYAKREIPGVLESPMIVVPVLRILRGVYGTDLQVALALLRMALVDLPGNLKTRAYWFWKLKILRRDPDVKREKALARIELDHKE